jgi:hypothetical protein
MCVLLAALPAVGPLAAQQTDRGAPRAPLSQRQQSPSTEPRNPGAPAPAPVAIADAITPRIGRITFDGLERTDREVILRLIDLQPGALLNASRLSRASRRLGELPIAGDATIEYRPGEQNTADLHLTFDEQTLFPDGWKGWSVVGAEAIFKDHLSVEIAGPLGRGDVWDVGYRWKPERPLVSLALEIPAGPLPGVAVIDGFWERQTYRIGPAAGSPLLEEREIRIGAALADWATPTLRWQAGAAFNRFDDRSYGALQGSLDRRLLSERLALVLELGHWISAGEDDAFSRGNVAANWRSRAPTGRYEPGWTAWLGYTATTARAPLALWPGASTGKGRNAILRAHKLLEEDIVTGEVFGRRLLYSTVEYERPLYVHDMGAVGWAVFVDGARAWDRIFDNGPSPFHVDVGFGIRLRTPGFGGAIRMDYAKSLRDGRSAVSTAWVGSWPSR